MKRIMSIIILFIYASFSFAKIQLSEIDFVQAMTNCDRLKSNLDRFLLDEPRRMLFLKFQHSFETYVRAQKRSSGVVIPKIIHQIWVGKKKIPDRCLEYMASCKRSFSGWTYILWTDETVAALSLINSDLFINSMNMGERADVLRYEILYHIGGLYVDVDFEPLDTAFFEQLHENCDFYAGLLPPETGVVVANGVIGCKAGHPLMLDIITALQTSWHKSGPILERTGPEFMTSVLEQSAHWRTGINVIVPANMLYPYSWCQLDGDSASLIRQEAVAKHYFTGTWNK